MTVAASDLDSSGIGHVPVTFAPPPAFRFHGLKPGFSCVLRAAATCRCRGQRRRQRQGDADTRPGGTHFGREGPLQRFPGEVGHCKPICIKAMHAPNAETARQHHASYSGSNTYTTGVPLDLEHVQPHRCRCKVRVCVCKMLWERTKSFIYARWLRM